MTSADLMLVACKLDLSLEIRFSRTVVGEPPSFVHVARRGRAFSASRELAKRNTKRGTSVVPLSRTSGVSGVFKRVRELTRLGEAEFGILNGSPENRREGSFALE